MSAPCAADDRNAQIQRVLHVAGGMIRRHVQRFEVVVVVLDFGSLEDLVAHAGEDVFDLLADTHQRVDAPDRRLASGQGDIDGSRRRSRLGDSATLLLDRGFDFGLEGVDETPELAASLGRERAERLHQPGHRAGLAAQKVIVERLERRLGRGRVEPGAEVRAQRVDIRTIGQGVSHGSMPNAQCRMPNAQPELSIEHWASSIVH